MIDMPPARKAKSSVHGGVAHCHKKHPRDEAQDYGSDEMSRLYLEDLPCVSGKNGRIIKKKKIRQKAPPWPGRPFTVQGIIDTNDNVAKDCLPSIHPTRQALSMWMVTLLCGRARPMRFRVQG